MKKNIFLVKLTFFSSSHCLICEMLINWITVSLSFSISTCKNWNYCSTSGGNWQNSPKNDLVEVSSIPFSWWQSSSTSSPNTSSSDFFAEQWPWTIKENKILKNKLHSIGRDNDKVTILYLNKKTCLLHIYFS